MGSKLSCGSLGEGWYYGSDKMIVTGNIGGSALQNAYTPIFALVRVFGIFPIKKMLYFEKKIEKITEKKNVMGVREALIQEGVEKGEERRNYFFVKNLLTQTTFSVSKIASLTGVSEAFVRKIKKDLSK